MKLPILQTDQGIATGPAPQASLALYGAPAGAASDLALDTGRVATGVSIQYAQIEAEKEKKRQTTEAMDLFTDASRATNALHMALMTAPDRDSKTHLGRFDEGFKAIQQATLDKTQDPGVRGATQALLKRLYLEESNKAMRAANEMFLDEEKAATIQTTTTMTQEAAAASTEAGRQFYLGLLTGFLESKRGIWTRQEIQKMQTEAKEEVYGNAARREINAAAGGGADPGAVDLEPYLRHLPLSKQTQLSEYQARKQEATVRERVRLQEKQDREQAQREEEERKAQVDVLDDLADTGALSEDALREARENRVAIGTDYRRLAEKVRNRLQAGGRTDDAVYNRLELDLLENPQSHSAAEIRRIQITGKLAATGPRSAASLIKLIKDAKDKPDKDITKEPLFQQGLHDLRESLRGGKGPLESLTGQEQGRLENAEREYHDIARSGKFPLADLPEMARKIIDRKRKEMPGQMQGDPTGAYRLRYTNPKDLMEAFRLGLIPEAEFNRQVNMMKEMGLIPAGAPTKSDGGR
jgi:hypothetical protein